MASNWFVRRDDEEFGPFTPDEIRQRAAEGWLRKIDFVRSNKEMAWIPATRIKDLKFGSTKSIEHPAKHQPRTNTLPVPSGFQILVNEQGVFVSSKTYRVQTAFGSSESDLNGYDSASIQENKPLFFGKPTYTVVLHGWGVDKYSPCLTHADRAFVERVVNALNVVIAATLAQDSSTDSQSYRSDPQSGDRPFKILAPLLGDEEIQFLILMMIANTSLHQDTDLWFEYSMGDTNQTCGKGPSFSIADLHDKLCDAEILTFQGRDQIGLTSIGKEFARWLIENGFRAEYFASSLGHWGQKPVNEFWDL